ncbi:MAG: hypothetical protein NTW79_00665 [Candidatus Berkelbacteria bacterium]|nr:hypothetical protein [Candidatus Berkelbacteria bacterium]
MSAKNLVAQIGQVATKGKHKDGFLFIGTIEPENTPARFFYLIEIESPWVAGEKIRDTILDALTSGLSDDKKNPTDDFEETIKNINLALGDLSQSGEHEWIGKLNAIVGVVDGDELVFSQTGKISGYLFRGNKISHITEKPISADEVHPLKTFVSLIDGNVDADDKIVIGNSNLYSRLTLDKIRDLVNSGDHRIAIAEMVKILRRSKVKDINSIVINFSGTLADDTKTDDGSANRRIDDRPEIIILDDIPDSPLLHYSKVIYRGVKAGAKVSGRATVASGKKLAEFWARNISPKLSSSAKKVGSRAREFGGAAIKPVSNKFGAPRVNYFSGKKNRRGSFFTNLGFWFKEMIKPEKRRYLYITLIVILLAVGFIKILINNRHNVSVVDQSQGLTSLDSARSTYQQALTDIGLKKSTGKQELVDAFGMAKNAESSAAIHDEAINLENQIQAKLDEMNLATRISAGQAPSLTLTSSDEISYAVGAVIYTFAGDGWVRSYDTRTKNVSKLATLGSADGKIKSPDFSTSAGIFYLYVEAKKVVKFSTSDNSLADVSLASGATWEDATAIAVFSTNIYLLDSGSGKIWKHTLSDSTYSAGTSVLAKANDSIKNAVGISIDGDIYVLTSDGKVLRIRKGAVDTTFALGAIPTPDATISSPAKIYASADSSAIFILDKTANRVLEFSKSGNYLKQFVADSSLPLSDFAVNGKLGKLWLISGSKVFEETI